MESFSTFFERRERNPLRKKELEQKGVIDNDKWIEQQAETRSPDEKREIKNLSRRKTASPNSVEDFKQKLADEKRRKLVPDYLKGKFSFDDKKLVGQVRKVKIYADQYVENLAQSKKQMIESVEAFLMDYKDIIPIRGFVVIISNSKNNPNFGKLWNLGSKESAGAFYDQNKIYIDESQTKHPDILLHEYAHLLADRVSKQVVTVLRREYEKMINDFFTILMGKRTRKRHLEGEKNAFNRIVITKKLNIPDLEDKMGYGATNFNEWFAVTIQKWKEIPNNKATYRFKQVMKKIINRL
jgi:hypothetical protein